MFDWELRDPAVLLVLLAAPPFYWLLTRRMTGVVTYSTLTLVSRAPRLLRARLANLPALLLAASVVAMAIALPARARPMTRRACGAKASPESWSRSWSPAQPPPTGHLPALLNPCPPTPRARLSASATSGCESASPTAVTHGYALRA